MSKRTLSPNLPSLGSQFDAWARALVRRLTEILIDLADRAETLDSDMEIEDGVIGTDALADQAVTTPKIADAAVTGTKIAARTIGRNKLAKDGVASYNNSSQTIPTGVWTTVQFNAVHFNEGGYVDSGVAPYGVVVPADGCYALDVHVTFAANSVGIRQARLLVNSVEVISFEQAAAQGVGFTLIDLNLSTLLYVGDVVEVIVRQTSGGNLALLSKAPYTPRLSVIRFW